MPATPRRTFALIPLCAVSVWCSNRGAVVTNILPPGGEGPASVALGVAVPGGLPSMEVNPALLAWEGARTSSLIQYSGSESELLPKLKMKDEVTESVKSVGLRWPVKPGTDVALGYSWHRVDFGRNTIFDQEGAELSTFESEETVHHAVVAARLGGIASVGAGWRFLDSRLVPAGMRLDDTTVALDATAQAWDFGLQIAPRWRIPKTPLRAGPSMGVAWISTLSDSIDYTTGRGQDPVTSVRRWGVAGTLVAPDLFEGVVFQDEEVDLADAKSRDAQTWRGWSVEVLGFYRRTSAELEDPTGDRFETQVSNQWTLDLKHLHRLYSRLRTGNWMEQLPETSEGYPLPTWTLFDTPITPNIRLTLVSSEITDETTGGVRQGQERLGFALSL